jgi:cytochrome c biogenesis protein CcmG/thiol:disulfide interchange protein DsbE
MERVMSRKKGFIFVLIALVFLWAFASQPMGNRAPEFSLKDLDGREIHSSSFENKVVLLNFWATWCPPCLAEIPALVSLHNIYQSQGVEVVGITLDEESGESLKRFVADKRMTYTVLVGDEKVTEAFGGIRGIPATFLIDRQGRIVKKFLGEQKKSVFEKAIREIL